MQWNSASEVATYFLSANPVAIVVTCLVAFLLPLCLHFFLYRTVSTSKPDEFLLLGSSGSGKTALCALVSISLHAVQISASINKASS